LGEVCTRYSKVCKRKNDLPTLEKLFPFCVVPNVSPVQVDRRGARLARFAQQPHVGLLERAPPFFQIAGWAGGDQVRPTVLSAAMARDDVVQGKLRFVLSTVLTAVVIPAKYFLLGKTNAGIGSLDHVAKPDN